MESTRSDAPPACPALQHHAASSRGPSTLPALSLVQIITIKGKKDNFFQPDGAGWELLLDGRVIDSVIFAHNHFFYLQLECLEYFLGIMRIFFLLLLLFHFVFPSHTYAFHRSWVWAGHSEKAGGMLRKRSRPCRVLPRLPPLSRLAGAFAARVLSEVSNSAGSRWVSTVPQPWNTKSLPSFHVDPQQRFLPPSLEPSAW